MHYSLMEILRCPACSGNLTLSVYKWGGTKQEVSSGLLRCGCGLNYAVWRGVPRMIGPEEGGFADEFVIKYRERLVRDAPGLFVPDGPEVPSRNYSFDVEWSMYRYGNLTWELDLPTRVNYVYQYLQVAPGSLNNKIVLDAGCGNGTLSAGLAASGPRVIALDYSVSVERAESEKRQFAGEAADRLDYVQGDVQHLPFAPGSFDIVYSDGVLHHTPDTRISFHALAPLRRFLKCIR